MCILYPNDRVDFFTDQPSACFGIPLLVVLSYCFNFRQVLAGSASTRASGLTPWNFCLSYQHRSWFQILPITSRLLFYFSVAIAFPFLSWHFSNSIPLPTPVPHPDSSTKTSRHAIFWTHSCFLSLHSIFSLFFQRCGDTVGFYTQLHHLMKTVPTLRANANKTTCSRIWCTANSMRNTCEVYASNRSQLIRERSLAARTEVSHRTRSLIFQPYYTSADLRDRTPLSLTQKAVCKWNPAITSNRR